MYVPDSGIHIIVYPNQVLLDRLGISHSMTVTKMKYIYLKYVTCYNFMVHMCFQFRQD